MFQRIESRSHREDWRHVFRIAAGLTFVYACIVFGFIGVQRAETVVLPVVSPFDIIQPHRVPGGTMFAADATKFRDCYNWIETRWYLGERDGRHVLITS